MLEKIISYSLLSILLVVASCSGDTSQIDSLFKDEDVSQEIVREVLITYSDSANVILQVSSPLLIRKEIHNSIMEEFPEGIFVQFLQGGHKAESWLKADAAVHYPEDKKIILRGNVELFNDKNDKLETAELIWNHQEQKISTEKFVRITQPSKGDTTYGFGFESDQHFNRFEIKRSFSGKVEEEMLNELK